MGPPFKVGFACLYTYSFRSKAFPDPCFLVPSQTKGFHLHFSVFEFLHDGDTLFRVEYPYSYVLDRIEGTSCCWLLRPCLVCRFAI